MAFPARIQQHGERAGHARHGEVIWLDQLPQRKRELADWRAISAAATSMRAPAPRRRPRWLPTDSSTTADAVIALITVGVIAATFFGVL